MVGSAGKSSLVAEYQLLSSPQKSESIQLDSRLSGY
jgi:hypothetical protein